MLCSTKSPAVRRFARSCWMSRRGVVRLGHRGLRTWPELRVFSRQSLVYDGRLAGAFVDRAGHQRHRPEHRQVDGKSGRCDAVAARIRAVRRGRRLIYEARDRDGADMESRLARLELPRKPQNPKTPKPH